MGRPRAAPQHPSQNPLPWEAFGEEVGVHAVPETRPQASSRGVGFKLNPIWRRRTLTTLIQRLGSLPGRPFIRLLRPTPRPRVSQYLLPRGCLGWGCPRPGEGRPSSPAHQSMAEGHVRRVKGGPTGLLGWACWEGGLSGPEGGGRRVWSGIWRGEPTRVIYAPSLGPELRGTAMQTTKGRFSRRPPAQTRLPKKQSRPVTATSKVPRPFPTP